MLVLPRPPVLGRIRIDHAAREARRPAPLVRCGPHRRRQQETRRASHSEVASRGGTASAHGLGSARRGLLAGVDSHSSCRTCRRRWSRCGSALCHAVLGARAPRGSCPRGSREARPGARLWLRRRQADRLHTQSRSVRLLHVRTHTARRLRRVASTSKARARLGGRRHRF